MSKATCEKADVLTGRVEPGMTFVEQCWVLCARIPAGKVATYGDIANALGKPGAARAVGRAMATNPFAPDVPCHRVVAGDGRLTGYSADGGVDTKADMLRAEGVAVEDGRADLKQRFTFN